LRLVAGEDFVRFRLASSLRSQASYGWQARTDKWDLFEHKQPRMVAKVARQPVLILQIVRTYLTQAPNAPKVGYPERFAQQALGHNSKAVHHAYSKHADVTVPSLDDWEKEWGKNSQRSVQPKLLPVDFRSALKTISQVN
jgi:hypothetical protein